MATIQQDVLKHVLTKPDYVTPTRPGWEMLQNVVHDTESLREAYFHMLADPSERSRAKVALYMAELLWDTISCAVATGIDVKALWAERVSAANGTEPRYEVLVK